MRSVLSVLTVLWVASATSSPLPAQVHAEPRTAPELKEPFRYELTGLSLLRPYVRGKTPVLFVHGLWARPASWRRMIEALAADPAIDGGFQFWTFGYASGNPIPYSGYLLRRDLDEVRRRLDPGKTDPALDRMVLVGHSMGGLLCKMIAVDSGHRLWRAVSDRPVDQLKGEGEDCKLMRECLIFGAHPGVCRVIYIATPHRGSRIDSGSVQAIGTRLVLLPDALRSPTPVGRGEPSGLFPRAVSQGSAKQYRRAGMGITNPDGALGIGPPAGTEGAYDYCSPPRLTAWESDGRRGKL